MPKRELIIFVVIDLLLIIAAIIAVIHRVRVLNVIIGFAVLSVINGLWLIVTVVQKTKQGGEL